MRQLRERDFVHIENKKPSIPVSPALHEYLSGYQRIGQFQLLYKDLLGFQDAIGRPEEDGTESYWDEVIYPPGVKRDIHKELLRIYANLKTPESPDYISHLSISRIEFCRFGNTQPFRIRVVNRFNDNHDYYYVKKVDGSRVYGLEMEHILAPNRIDFLVNRNTLVEEHISGIPGDIFLKKDLPRAERDLVRIGKEFVKFSERCFAKLLGDMRAYNYVVVITRDFDMAQYRVRAIDFDQQSYEGDLKVYLPQFYRENQPAVDLVWRLLPAQTIRQYQREEHSLIARRMKTSRHRMSALLDVMEADKLSPEDNVKRLGEALARYHNDDSFRYISNMGTLTRHHLEVILQEWDQATPPGHREPPSPTFLKDG